MANTIALAKNYTSILDEVYCGASVTADLTSDNSMVRAGANANEIIYPQISVTGLGDYSRNSGYTQGSVDLEWKTATFNYDRGTKISVDVMDDEESRDIAFTMAGAELMRTKVAPEADAFTFATLAGTAGISTATPATYADATEFLQALIEAKVIIQCIVLREIAHQIHQAGTQTDIQHQIGNALIPVPEAKAFKPTADPTQSIHLLKIAL